MNVRAILEGLKHLGIELRADSNHLYYEGPEEAITPELLDTLREHKPELIKMLVDKECCQAHVVPSIGPSMHQLIGAGFKPKERCEKTIWQRPDTGFWVSQEMALHLLKNMNVEGD